ncbi:membrane protein [Kitasatospora sp. MMS16-BH015]|uniref:UbiA family prenyltransferase n=1 Tax=Kitasatospora sp. MMS16-BH015 TaxID=2018025 RepID=UPI000CA3456F|nr:UbiA family prenyltransferase [Kitasatospora sp. MMS16-BH015]AUG75109.1 membrane protein [Kitasatospora sp. MMS16-BH015]
MVTPRHFAPTTAPAPTPARSFLGLLAAAHPAPAAAVTVVATALAAGAGRGPGSSALVGLAVLAGQLSVGWCNDRADLGRDLATGRTDKPLVTGAARPELVTLAAGGALAACLPLSLAASGLAAGAAHLLGVAAAWAYNLGLKRTLWSWLPYALAFGLLPVFALGGPTPARAIAAGALLGIGAHAANVLPDIADDLRTGIRGLPQRLGPALTRLLAATTLFTASAVLLLTPTSTLPPATLLAPAALATTTALPLPGRRPFTAALALALLDVALLLLNGTALRGTA